MGYNPYNPGAVGLPQTMMKTVRFSDDGVAVTFPEIPDGSWLLRAWADVTTGFDDTGTDLLDLGWNGAAEGHDADLDLSSIAVVAAAPSTPIKLPSGKVYQALYTGQNGNSAAGSADVYVEFIPPPE